MRVLFTLAAVLLVALVPPTARASHLKEQPKKHKIVYHLDEAGLDKARSVLGDIENHIRGVGGADHIEAIELVGHRAAPRHFVPASMDARRKSVPSSPARATSWTATGRPVPEHPSSRTIAGWPVRLNQTVNGEKAKTRRQYSSTSSIIISIQPSFGGRVPSPGVSSTSQRSWNAAICRRRAARGARSRIKICALARGRPSAN